MNVLTLSEENLWEGGGRQGGRSFEGDIEVAASKIMNIRHTNKPITTYTRMNTTIIHRNASITKYASCSGSAGWTASHSADKISK